MGPAFDGTISVGDVGEFAWDCDDTACGSVPPLEDGGVADWPDHNEVKGGTAERPRDEYLKDMFYQRRGRRAGDSLLITMSSSSILL